MVTNDGREGMHKNYMWVYRSGSMCKANPIIVYDYQKTRKADALQEFLKDFEATRGFTSVSLRFFLSEGGSFRSCLSV